MRPLEKYTRKWRRNMKENEKESTWYFCSFSSPSPLHPPLIPPQNPRPSYEHEAIGKIHKKMKKEYERKWKRINGIFLIIFFTIHSPSSTSPTIKSAASLWTWGHWKNTQENEEGIWKKMKKKWGLSACQKTILTSMSSTMDYKPAKWECWYDNLLSKWGLCSPNVCYNHATALQMLLSVCHRALSMTTSALKICSTKRIRSLFMF